jgi:hypothetical protein
MIFLKVSNMNCKEINPRYLNLFISHGDSFYLTTNSVKFNSFWKSSELKLAFLEWFLIFLSIIVFLIIVYLILI